MGFTSKQRLSGLGGINRSIKTQASIHVAIRFIEVRNPPTTKRWQHEGRRIKLKKLYKLTLK